MMTVSVESIKELRARTHMGMTDCKKALEEASGDLDGAVEILKKKGLRKLDTVVESLEGEVRAQASGPQGVIFEINCQTDFAARSEPFQKFLAQLTPDQFCQVAVAGSCFPALRPNLEREMESLSAVLGEKVMVRRISLQQATQPQGDVVVHAYNHPGGRIAVLVSLLADQSEAAKQAAEHVAMHIAATAPKYVHRIDIPADVVGAQRMAFKQEIIDENAAKPSPKVLQDAMVDKIVEGKLNRWFAESVLVDQQSVVDPKRTISQVLADAAKEAQGRVAVLEFTRYERGEK